MRLLALTMFVAVSLMPNARAAPSVAELAAGLQGEPRARVDAVQLLPRYGADAVRAVLPLLTHDDPTVAKAAYNVLWAVANQAGRSGRTEEALEISSLLAAHLVAGQQDPVTDKLLRLLAVSVPEGFDVEPIARLLGDTVWREAARTTLERIGTPEARAALRDAIGEADPAFACALLGSLAQLRDAETCPVALQLTRHRDPAVRAAAAYALAWTGDTDYIAALRMVRRRASTDTKVTANEALLRLAEAMSERESDRSAAAAVYREVLGDSPSSAARDAAIAGLGKCGDAADVALILAAAEHGGATATAVAVHSLAAIAAPGADEAIASAYETAPAAAKLPLLAMMGKRGGSVLLPKLAAAAASEDRETRLAALRALGDCGDVTALAVLTEAASTGTGSDRETAIASLERLASSARDPELPGQAYAALLVTADDAAVRRRALEGLAAHPFAGALEGVLAASRDPALADVAARALVGMTGACVRAGRVEEAREALDVITRLPLVGDSVAALIGQLAPFASELDVAARLGFITEWQVVGPFPFGGPGTGLDDVNIGEPAVNLDAAYPVGGRELRWIAAHAYADGLFDLTPLYGMCENVVCYAYSRITVPEAIDAVVRMGSDDGIKVWVNGEVIHNHDVDRGSGYDQDSAVARLRAGANDLLIKVSQGRGGWNFRLRLTTPDGVAVRAVQ